VVSAKAEAGEKLSTKRGEGSLFLDRLHTTSQKERGAKEEALAPRQKRSPRMRDWLVPVWEFTRKGIWLLRKKKKKRAETLKAARGWVNSEFPKKKGLPLNKWGGDQIEDAGL